MQMQAQEQALGGTGAVGKEKSSPTAQASPLKTEIKSNNLQNK